MRLPQAHRLCNRTGRLAVVAVVVLSGRQLPVEKGIRDAVPTGSPPVQPDGQAGFVRLVILVDVVAVVVAVAVSHWAQNGAKWRAASSRLSGCIARACLFPRLVLTPYLAAPKNNCFGPKNRFCVVSGCLARARLFTPSLAVSKKNSFCATGPRFEPPNFPAGQS